MSLYVQGNGFDIAHGIKAPYSAFGAFLSEHHESFLTRF
ncbi:MAG: AbiH family protein [Acutalibacteraceae bacterium]